ncbi:hypothetical protein JKP88DRAFT_241418 [Tribonema minus]|uniref:CBP/p300-type HAT domain-containing protein n=1 Tax=Tribonema minus TaxID=303371 RepID=A0A835Z6P2_9STRA|nr:hypothetical protein JKP88DRAFT_241418 [Tribonema minus]
MPLLCSPHYSGSVATLPPSFMAAFIQEKVNHRQQELNPDIQPDELVHINVPSNMDTSFDMPRLYKAAFYPLAESFQVRYTSKTVCAYQVLDGQPVLVLVLFCQEYRARHRGGQLEVDRRVYMHTVLLV